MIDKFIHSAPTHWNSLLHLECCAKIRAWIRSPMVLDQGRLLATDIGPYPTAPRVVALHQRQRPNARKWKGQPCWHQSGIIKGVYTNYLTKCKRITDTIRTHPLHRNLPFVIGNQRVACVPISIRATSVGTCPNHPMNHLLRRPMPRLKIRTRLMEWNLTCDTVSPSVWTLGGMTNLTCWKQGYGIRPSAPRSTQPPPWWIGCRKHHRQSPKLHIVTRRQHSQSDTPDSLQSPKPCHINSPPSSFRSNNKYCISDVELT